MPTSLFRYMSWNIKQFSNNRSNKIEIFMNARVKYWIAYSIRQLEASMISIMEVTIATGAIACDILLEAIKIEATDALSTQKPKWLKDVSIRNVPKDDRNAKKADSYCIFWDSTLIELKSIELITNEFLRQYNYPPIPDRYPLYCMIESQGHKIDFLTWHAPQPKNSKGETTIDVIASIYHLINQVFSDTNDAIISGDFNYDTGNLQAYEPLTTLGFKGAFNGRKTSLTTLDSFKAKIKDKVEPFINGKYEEVFGASAYDNIFLKGVFSMYPEILFTPLIWLNEEYLRELRINFHNVDFILPQQLEYSMEAALTLSDHFPIVVDVCVR